jgi:feruloyl-CoA synthase
MSTTAAPHVFANPRASMQRRGDAGLLLRSEDALRAYDRSLAHVLRRRAESHPERVLASQRRGAGWESLTYGAARGRADAVAQTLLERGCERPLMILSGNSLEHLVVTLGAYTAGVPVMPVSVAYSLMSRDHARIRAIAGLCSPGLVFADDHERFGAALAALAPDAPAVTFDELAAATPGPDVERALDAVGPDTVAKLLFTSGSTGVPKGVINTHRMMCSNQQALRQAWPFLAHEPPVLVDWLPWSHTFGGNHNMNLVLVNGGTLHIDDGKPAPELFDRTIEALRRIPPTLYFNVPAGYALLVTELERDRAFAETFLSRLRFMLYAAAALPPALWARLEAVVAELAEHPVPLTSSWGATETAPCVTTAHFPSTCGCIGVPLPGVTVKLAPDNDKLSIRVAGPNITPGYINDPVATAQAFDDEGFYITGDAARLVDERDPNQGLMFDGRLAEDFKLSTGTFVAVSAVRTALVSACGVLSDAVVAGHDEAYASALGWVNQAEARTLWGEDVPLDHPALRDRLARALRKLNEDAVPAARIERLLLLDEPPSLDGGEITDKGYVNQRRVLERRADEVSRLYAEPVGPACILPSDPPDADRLGGTSPDA